jgi:sugar/nucleoside kinase (ribokinase family)
MSLFYDVIIVGDYCLDWVFTGLPAPPTPGKEIVAGGFDMVPGGTCNTAFALHRLGVNVGWAGDFGSDPFSQQVLSQARGEGLDDRLFVHHNRPLRRVTVSASFPGDRAFIAYYDPEARVPAGIKALAKASARLVFVPGLYAGSAFQLGRQLIRAKKMRLAMDGNNSLETTIADARVREVLASLDLFLPNRSEALRLAGERDLDCAARRLGELCPLVVIKDGANGAIAIEKGEIYRAPAIPVTPVDTTGAGDVFDAGFIKAWLDGRPVSECLRWGNVVGGLSTLGLGGVGRTIQVKEVEDWLT